METDVAVPWLVSHKGPSTYQPPLLLSSQFTKCWKNNNKSGKYHLLNNNSVTKNDKTRDPPHINPPDLFLHNLPSVEKEKTKTFSYSLTPSLTSTWFCEATGCGFPADLPISPKVNVVESPCVVNRWSVVSRRQESQCVQLYNTLHGSDQCSSAV